MMSECADIKLNLCKNHPNNEIQFEFLYQTAMITKLEFVLK